MLKTRRAYGYICRMDELSQIHYNDNWSGRGWGVVVSIVFLIFYICVSDEYMYYFNK